MEKLLQAVKSLISDIDSMRQGQTDTFGGFSEWSHGDGYETMEVEWPNLAISTDNVKDALGEFADNTAPVIHWHEQNPWKDKIVYITVDEMTEILATDYQPKNQLLRHFAQYGEKLDAYLMPNFLTDTPTAGIRFGAMGEEYLSLYIPQERMGRVANHLLKKLKGL